MTDGDHIRPLTGHAPSAATGLPAVVITGYGMASAAGCTPADVVARLRRGEPGLAPAMIGGELSLLMGSVDPAGLGRYRCDDPEQDHATAYANHSTAQALHMAGVSAADLEKESVLLVVGSSKGRMGNLLPGRNARAPLPDFRPEHVLGDTLGLAVAREFGLRGSTVLNCPAACATGIVCLIRAIHGLQHYEADWALAGSAESSGRALLLAAFQNMGALAPEVMRPFHVDRRGFNPGGGGAVFLLEREEDARRRGAPILARLAGWDQRSDASHITAADSSGATVAYAIRRTLERADWPADAVDYINVHGTATPLNDHVEAMAVRAVFPENPPPVSALKPYIGHLLGASSAVELALVLASARDGYLPATPLLDFPDPTIPLRFVPAGGLEGSFRRILKLSLGFGGHLGVMALEIL